MTELWRGAAPLILASKSAARQRLLTAAGVPFESHAVAIDERAIAPKPCAERPGRLVTGADQTLCLEGRVFGKPADRAAAKAQLEAMSSRTHELHSGCCVVRDNAILFETVCVARLSCRRLSPAFITAFMAQGDDALLASAGAYQLEGLGIHLFEAIEGDHATILGLPLLPLLKFLREEGSLLS
jgi:septum formation protein